MIKSDDLLLMSYLSSERSIAAVGRRMYLTPSAISQKLASLEEKLGLKLAERHGRSGIILTADGEFLADRGLEVRSELAFVQDELNKRKGVISGVISVTASFGFGRCHVAPALGKCSEIYPNISIDLKLSDDLSHVPQSAWDILIRISPQKNTPFTCTEISNNRRLVCASPAYVKRHGKPQHPDCLKQHGCISISEDGRKGTYWSFIARNGVEKTVKVMPRFRTNDGETALDWAINSLGIIVRSEWSVLPAIKAGRLVELLPDWSAPDAPIVALTKNHPAESVRIQTVLNYLTQNLMIE